MADGDLDLAGVEDAFPLSPAQQGMLYHSLAEPGTGVYLGLFIARLPGDLDLPKFRRAWDAVISRHQCLRSQFVWDGLDDPVQVVRDQISPDWEEEDWADLDEATLRSELSDRLRREGLDLSIAPAMRFVIARAGDGHSVFAWVCHHALLDDWSQAIVLDEVERIYGGEERLPDAMPYRDFADWLAGSDPQADDRYWSREFQGFREPTRLQLRPSAHPERHADAYGVAEAVVESGISAPLAQLAADLRVTVGALITTAWGVVLHRLAGGDDVCFGVAATQRPPDLPGVEQAVGNFVTTVAARLRFDGSATLRDEILRRHAAQMEAPAHANISLTRLQELAGQPANAPLFDTIVSIKQDALSTVRRGALFGEFVASVRSNFKIALIAMPGTELRLRILFDQGTHTQDSAELILSLLTAALEAMPSHLGEPPADLRVMSRGAMETATLGYASRIPLGDCALVHEAILDKARSDPDAAAVVHPDGALSYGDLDRRSEAFARRLAGQGIGPGGRAAILMDQGPLVLVAMLACLRAGCAYVPLDARYPSDRLARMLEKARPGVIIVDEGTDELVPAGSAPVLRIDATGAGPDADLPRAGPDDPAYVMFTSGSTGQPKGVMISHASLAASTAARSAWYGTTPERFLLLSSFSFDSSVAGIYWTLCGGGTLVLIPPEHRQDLHAIASAVEDHGVTDTLCLPSVHDLLLDTATPQQLATLRLVIVAGEEATPTVVRKHSDRLPGARLVNEYGPTEGTVWSTVCDLTGLSVETGVPIGEAVPGTRLVLRDTRGRPVPAGLPAELHIGGRGVALGYFEQPEETHARFLDDPADRGAKIYRTGDLVVARPDGTLDYLGRIDGQVKIRGHRVELGEIEAVFASRPDIREAAVVPFGRDGAAVLVAYLAPESDFTADQEALLAYGRKALPDYMAPARFVLVDALPRLANGKIDRKALPSPDRQGAQTARVPPSTSMEATLEKIWRKVLWLDREISMTEDFFELGGHSLLSMRLVNEIEKALDLKVPVSRLGKITTVAAQARLLDDLAREMTGPAREPETNMPEAAATGPLAGLNAEELRQLRSYVASWHGEPPFEGSMMRVLNADGSMPPLFFCCTGTTEFERLARELGPDQPVFGFRAGNVIVDHPSEERQQIDQRRVALSYLPEILRLTDGEPVFLGGTCQGATIALNIAAFLKAMQRPVATVILIEKTPPIDYNGRINIVIARDSFLNPYLRFQKPELAWNRRYSEYTLDFIGGGYSQRYTPPYLYELTAIIRERLAEARSAPLISLPQDGFAATLDGVSAPVSVAPGDRIQATIRVRNDSPRVWGPTEESGIRLQARWLTTRGDPVEAPWSHASIPRVEPGDAAELGLLLTAPTEAGPYRVGIDLVEEGIAKFSQRGSSPLELSLLVDPAAPRREVIETEAGAENGEAAPDLEELLASIRRTRESGRFSEALAQIASIRADAASLLREEGLCHLAEGSLREGAQSLAAARAADPTDARAALGLARARRLQGRLPEAWLLLREAARLSTDPAIDAGIRGETAKLNIPKRAMRKLRRMIRRP